jgi:hypothetical protein
MLLILEETLPATGRGGAGVSRTRIKMQEQKQPGQIEHR